MTMNAQTWRIAAGVGVLAALAGMGALLLPPYYENWKFQDSLSEMMSEKGAAALPPEALRVAVVNRAAGLGLPVHNGDVRVIKKGAQAKVEVLYVVRVDFPLYTVDLHFHPAAP